jgi:2'-hydroxyisoflavone reductase
MKLLILGGTAFLGRHLTEQALLAGHQVTLFNRGRTNPDLFAGQVEKVIGDRATDLALLSDRHFDACIDPSGYLPGDLATAGAAKAKSDPGWSCLCGCRKRSRT